MQIERKPTIAAGVKAIYVYELDSSVNHSTQRGFTAHEHLDRTGFVHMNGRVYDPRIGRFVSPDPIVQAPMFSQSYNRYSYVFNNPLSYTDPSGFGCGDTDIDPTGAQLNPCLSGLVQRYQAPIFVLPDLVIGGTGNLTGAGNLSGIFGRIMASAGGQDIALEQELFEERYGSVANGGGSSSVYVVHQASVGAVVRVLVKAGRALLRGSRQSTKGLDELFKGGRAPKASELKRYAEQQGWKPSQSQNGPLKYIDENGVVRMTIKRGSPRAPGSGHPHVELRNAQGQRVDPAGSLVTRKSPSNHTLIDYDL